MQAATNKCMLHLGSRITAAVKYVCLTNAFNDLSQDHFGHVVHNSDKNEPGGYSQGPNCKTLHKGTMQMSLEYFANLQV